MIYATMYPRRKRAMAMPHFGNLINEIMNAPVQELKDKRTHRYSHPAANVIKYENGYEIALAVPGMTKEDLTIQVDNGQLIISAKLEEKERDYKLREFNYGEFSRRFELPEDVNIDGIEAKAKDGVLYLKLPLIPEAEPKKITIK